MPLASTSAEPHASLQTNNPFLPSPFLCLLANIHKSCLEVTAPPGPSPAATSSGSEANHATALRPDLFFLGTARTPRLPSLASPPPPSKRQPSQSSPAACPSPCLLLPLPARRGGSRCVITSRTRERCLQLSLTVC